MSFFSFMTSFVTSVETFRTLLVMTIIGAMITAVLFLVKPLIKNRLPKTTQYYLWLVALVAFLLPTSAIIAIPAEWRSPSISNAVAWYVVTAEDVDKRIEPYERSDSAGYIGIPEEYQETVDALVPEPWVTEAVDWAKILWYMGALVSLSLCIFSYCVYNETIIQKHNKRAMPRHESMLAELTAKPPRLFLNAKAASPMLIGLFRPAIILPDREYSDEQLRAVLLHELTHLRRKDILVKWLSVIACSLHWFNPLVWLARRELDRACELACDEAVIRKLDAAGRQSYGDTLIAVAADAKMPRTVLSTTMCERKKSLKERLGAIMKHKKTTRPAVICSAGLVILLAGCAAILGAGAGTQADEFFFRPGERLEIARFDALATSDYADVTVKFVESEGPVEVLISVEQDGAESQEKTIKIAESATFIVNGYVDTAVCAEVTEIDKNVSGDATFESSISASQGVPSPTAAPEPPGEIPDNPDVPQEVIDAAVEFVKNDYETGIIGLEYARENGAEFDNWRIYYIEHAYRYDDTGVDVYRFEWRVHTTTPDKIVLAGGMDLDSDGWLLDTYPHSWYLIFRDTGGKPAFLTVMMENDCVPGDDMFTQDMLNRIGKSGSADENTPLRRR
ncbi:MAG: M56 family metallopeptidase [Clostridiales Family XIII bacterium]|jgi:beta-lactamase regulating signal transducer with metallopeptidase domain|nr:M56 family metallopeptidase [Clostridiales Family XIII bacterium]